MKGKQVVRDARKGFIDIETSRLK